MKPSLLVVDDFFENIEKVWSYATFQEFEEVELDGMVYKGVSPVIDSVLDIVVLKLGTIMQAIIDVKYAFLRLTTKDSPNPYWAHTDGPAAQYVGLIYLTEENCCEGGTVLLRHKDTKVRNDLVEEIWKRDSNDQSLWETVGYVEMRSNRAVIYPAGTLHAAWPAESFGSDEYDGRLTLTVFFDVR